MRLDEFTTAERVLLTGMPLALLARIPNGLGEFRPEEQAEIPYLVLCALRREAWEQHMRQVAALETIVAWSALMAVEHGGSLVRVWANELPWPTALMVVRYGEAAEFWPFEWSEKDVQRAQEWMLGRLPAGVAYLAPVEG